MLNLINLFMGKYKKTNKTNKTKSRTSPKGGNRGCLCDDGTYSKKCCNGDLQNQGIGSPIQGGESNVTNVNGVRTKSVQRG